MIDDYTRDIVFPARAVPVFAHIPPNVDPLSPAVIPLLKERIRTSEQEGVPIRAVLLCNPHNPIPQCYPLETIRGHLEIAREVSGRCSNTDKVVDGVCTLTPRLSMVST